MQQRHLIQQRPVRINSAASLRRRRMRMMIAALGAAVTATVMARA